MKNQNTHTKTAAQGQNMRKPSAAQIRAWVNERDGEEDSLAKKYWDKREADEAAQGQNVREVNTPAGKFPLTKNAAAKLERNARWMAEAAADTPDLRVPTPQELVPIGFADKSLEPPQPQAQHSPLPMQRIVAFVMEQIEERGYDLSDLGGKTCEEIAVEASKLYPHTERLADNAKRLAMLALQSERYTQDIDYQEATDAMLAALAAFEKGAK
jgi:hypothetical protein